MLKADNVEPFKPAPIPRQDFVYCLMSLPRNVRSGGQIRVHQLG
jgi:hypothetical protein